MKLNELPIDALGAILNGAHSFLVIELWKCGDTALNTKLANRGVEDVVLSKRVLDRRSRWPRMLKHLKLRSLSVESPHHLGSTEMIRRELKSLSPTIKSLRVLFEGAPTALIPCPVDNSFEDFSNSSEGPPPHENDGLREVDDGDDREFAQVFPNLEVFKIGIYSRFPTFERVSLASLPPSLHTLDLNDVEVHDYSGIPSTLRCITFDNGPEVTVSNLEALPSSLTQLKCEMSDEIWKFLLSPAGEAHFPELRFPPSTSIQPAHLALIAKLSSSQWVKRASKLRFYQFNDALLELWPLHASLTSLSLINCRLTGPLNPTSHPLPPTLKSLSLASLDWPSIIEAPHSLPKSLTAIQLDLDPAIGPQHFYLLPRDLKTLHITTSSYEDDGRTGYGPIEEAPVLTLAQSQLAQEDSHRWSEILKASRTPSGELDKRFSARNLNEIQNGRHFGLPLHLTTISTSGPLSYWAKFVLPPFVTAAYFQALSYLDPEFLLECLPPVTTDLAISGPSKLYCPTVSHWNSIETKSMRLFSNLTSLAFTAGDCPLPLNILSQLPNTLKSLKIEEFEEVDLSFLQHLPSGLTALNTTLHFKTGLHWASYLPRSLVVLNCSASMQGADLINLPRTLERLMLGGIFHLTSQHVSALPPALEFVWSRIDNRDDDYISEGDLESEESSEAHNEEDDFAISPSVDWDHLLLLRPLLPTDRPLSSDELEEYDDMVVKEEEGMSEYDIHPAVAQKYGSSLSVGTPSKIAL